MRWSHQYPAVGDRLWSLDEANAALPEVRRLLATARQAASRVRDEEDQVKDIEIVYGVEVREEGHHAHGEWQVRHDRMHAAKSELESAVQAFRDAGVVLKDIDLGLVDFPSERAGETVYLCWRAGETRIHSWHPVNQGFAGRKPLPDLPGV